MRHLLRLPAAAAAVCVGLAAQSPLTTTYATNNSGSVGGAIYFDLTAQTNLNVTGIDVDLNSAASTVGSVDIYMCPTTYLGNEANASAWTLVGSGTVTASGPGLPSTLALAAPFTIPQGTNGFAYVGVGHAFAYTNGTGANQTYSTLELQLDAGAAVNVAFTGTPFTPRVVNTTISYVGAGPGFATNADVGAGCIERAASFYEHFVATTDIDLSNSSLQMFSTGNGYVVLPGAATFVAPSAGATNLNLGDDTTTTVALTNAFAYPGGSTTVLDVCSNGMISVGSNGTSYQPSPSAFLGWANPAWVVWHDFICNTAGNVWFEEVGDVAYITWLDVIGYNGTSAGTATSRFQLQFDSLQSSVTFVFETMDNLSVSTWSGGDGYVVGYSPGGPSIDPGSTDLNGPTLPLVLDGADMLPLHLDISARPIQGTTVNLDTVNIPTTAVLGGIALGFSNPNFDLGLLGMPGCAQYADHVAVILFFPGGAPSATVPFAVPNAVGVQLFAQSFAVDLTNPLNAFGVTASQGLDLVIGSF